MNGRFWAATLAGLVLANLIDWLFAGVLFHDRYQAHPEVWRVKGANPRALIGAQAMTLPTVVGLIAVMIWTGQVSLAGSLILAVFIWAIAAAPPIIANALYIALNAARRPWTGRDSTRARLPHSLQGRVGYWRGGVA